jgi:hypothetical protein
MNRFWINDSPTEYYDQIDTFIDVYKHSHPSAIFNTDADCLTYLLWNINFEWTMSTEKSFGFILGELIRKIEENPDMTCEVKYWSMDEAATGTQFYFVEIRSPSSAAYFICMVFRSQDVPSENKGYLQHAQMIELNCLPVEFSIDAE